MKDKESKSQKYLSIQILMKIQSLKWQVVEN